MKLLSRIQGREKFFLFVTFFYILFNTFPLFGDVTHIPVQYVCVITVLLLIFLYPQTIVSKPTKWFFIFIIILCVNGLLGRHIHINGLSNYVLPLIQRIMIEIAWILPALLIMNILHKLNDVRIYKIIGYGSVIILTISFLYILPMIMNYANILREAMREDNMSFAKPMGLPDYTLMHSYTLMIPGLCLYTKFNNNKKKYWWTIFLIALFFYVITQTAVSTSIVLSVLIILFSIFYNDKNKLLTFYAFLLLIVFTYIAFKTGALLSFVDWLMPFFKDTAVSFKLQDLHDSILSGQLQGESFEGRANLHQISRDSFFRNPIFGGGIAGGHSQVLDLLGTVGLTGFIPFLMVICTSAQKYIQNVPSGISRVYMYLCFAIACIYLYHKGIFGAAGWLFMCVIAPCLIVAVSKK